jgi:hypothetical protein
MCKYENVKMAASHKSHGILAFQQRQTCGERLN